VQKVLIINTGGTFNKRYNPITGNLDIEPKGEALKFIAQAWLNHLEVINIIGKDSLEMTNEDRGKILDLINQTSHEDIIVVHGTDTMALTAHYLDQEKIKKRVILTGAMVPFSINPIEATANLASAYGFIQGVPNHGIYVAMNGKFGTYQKIQKNKEKGLFESIEC